MLHSTSGRQKYAMRMLLENCFPNNLVDSENESTGWNLKGTVISFETLKAMLLRENELRLSLTIQNRYREKGYDFYFEITESLQKQVAKEFALDEVTGMNYLQCAESLVAHNAAWLQEVREISLYRKYNRCHDGNLKVGDVAPLLASPLYDLLSRDSDVPANARVQESWFLNAYITSLIRASAVDSVFNSTVHESLSTLHTSVVSGSKLTTAVKPLVIISGSYS